MSNMIPDNRPAALSKTRKPEEDLIDAILAQGVDRLRDSIPISVGRWGYHDGRWCLRDGGRWRLEITEGSDVKNAISMFQDLFDAGRFHRARPHIEALVEIRRKRIEKIRRDWRGLRGMLFVKKYKMNPRFDRNRKQLPIWRKWIIVAPSDGKSHRREDA